MEKKTLYLPHELIVEILLRLPVKSLICFKCVCKLWYSLISNPHFSNSQFQLTAATHTRRIMSISVSHPESRSIDFETSFTYDHDHDHASFNVNFWLPQTDFPVEIKGSCRGLIFLYCRPYIYLWNPSTGFKKQIHVSPFDTKRAPERSKYSDHIYGFAYDQSRDDYLVVVLSHEPTEENPFSSHLEFFSNRDNRWKEIEGTHLPYGDCSTGLLFNGAIHWLSCRLDIKIDVIVAFDLLDRKLFEMPLPDNFHQEVSFAHGLWVFEEFFSLCAKDYSKRIIEIWVMKEYKLNSSWTKTHVLPLDSHDVFHNFYFTPICSTNNGDIIGTIPGSRLVRYNDKGKWLGYHSFSNSPSDIVMYTESLISLPGDNEQFIN